MARIEAETDLIDKEGTKRLLFKEMSQIYLQGIEEKKEKGQLRDSN